MALDFTAERYVSAVLSGEQIACEQVQLACRRHVDDLDSGHERGLHFDETAAKMAVAFFSVLRHWKGEWAGQPITLEPWQQFIVWSLFGWKRADGTRRFRTAYVETARKSGKTTMAAGIGLYLMTADREAGAEVYAVAVKKDQARIAWKDASEMVKKSARLKKEIGAFRNNLHHVSSSSKFEPLASDYNSMDGLYVHCAICDELHAWKGGYLWGVMDTATGSRRQPLMLGITTAGFDRESYCLELRDYVEKILAGVVQDDSFFGIIYTLDKEDQEEKDGDARAWWEREENWIKSNPNLGVSKKLDQMRRKAKQATEIPSNWVQFITKELNVWTQSETKWINLSSWRACGKWIVDPEELAGRECYGGLDLSSTTDLTAWVLVFPPVRVGEPWKVLCRFFMPQDHIIEREKKDFVPFTAWLEGGHVFTTPGNVVDYDFILEQIAQDLARYELKECAFDRWGSQKIVHDMVGLGFTQEEKEARLGRPLLVQFGQGFASMSGPSKELERVVLDGMLAHGDNPVLSWMASNVVVRIDPAENIKPDKEKSRERIDGIVALVMALGRAMAHGGAKQSVYATRGLTVL